MITNEYLVKLLFITSALWYVCAPEPMICMNPTWSPDTYNIKLHLDKNSNDFKGRVIIHGVTTQRTDTLDLNSDGLKIKEIKVNGWDRLSVLEQGNATLTVKLPYTLSKGVIFKLTIKYTGVITEDESGLFATSYQANDGSEKKVLASSFQPNGARKVFPCLDEPKYKAFFELTLIVWPNVTALSNMPSRSRNEINPQNVKFEFERSLKMSPYLLAFIIGEFEAVPLRKNTTVWIPSDSRKYFPLDLDYLTVALDVLESYTGIKYPMPKLDHVVSVGVRTYGAMENWGLITYSPTSLITDNSSKSIANEETIRTSTIHEIIHQWVGNLVTCKHWGYIWLNEGVTSFLVPIIWQQMSSLESNAENFRIEATRSAMLAEVRYPAALRGPETCDTNQINELFNEATYYKGAAVLQMVDEVVTGNCFRNGLRKYLKDNLYGSVTESQLWTSIDEICQNKFLPIDVNLETVMTTWTVNKGYPILVVHRDESTGQISVSQEICQIAEGASKEQVPRWWIPLSYTTSQDKDFESTRAKDWLEPSGLMKELNLKLAKEDWIVFNLKSIGYYRVQYDPLTWTQLSDYLANDPKWYAIHRINRANLVDDAVNFLLYDRLDYSTFFNLTRYLVREKDHTVWKTLSRGLTVMGMRWPLEYDLMKEYLEILVRPIFKKVTSKDFKADTFSRRSLRSTVIETACSVDHGDCKRLAEQTVRGLINGTIKQNEVSPDNLKVFWCTALSSGSLELWQYRINMNQNDTIFKDEIFWHCLDNDGLIKNVLEDALNGSTYLRSSVMEILNYFYTNKPCPLIEFLTENYEKIVEMYGFERIRTFCTDDIFDSYYIRGCEDKLKEFFQKRFNATPNIDRNKINIPLQEALAYQIKRLTAA